MLDIGRVVAQDHGGTTQQRSKQIDLLRQLAARLPDLPLDVEPRPAPRARQLQRRLNDKKIEELARRYQAGETVAALAMEYGVNPRTVSQRLKRAGVQLAVSGFDRRRKPEAERLYVSGRSLKQVAAVFGCDAETVRQILKRRGVKMRLLSERN